jgi:hypothetical protein
VKLHPVMSARANSGLQQERGVLEDPKQCIRAGGCDLCSPAHAAVWRPFFSRQEVRYNESRSWQAGSGLVAARKGEWLVEELTSQ